MVDYREILRLLSLGYNLTQISESLHSSRNTIRDVKERAEKIELQLSEDVTNQMLYELLYPERLEKVNVWMDPDCEHIHKELARKGVNLKLLWTEYKVSCENAGRVPYSYTQFCDIYRNWARKTKATMRINHKPGDSMEVDWAGGTVPIVDPVTGVVTDAYLFVGVLPCSCYAYAELCNDMQSENWLMAHVHAYEYYDGVPRLLISDNLKVGVTKNTRLETLINKSYMELADHYGTAVVPTRVEAPKDKSHAEGTVSFASTWILAALRNETFFSFSDAKAAVAEKLEDLNTIPFQKRKGNRREAYLFEEKEFMQPLPPNPYEPSVWSEQKVLYDYTITDGINKYSVPFDLIGETVDIRITRDTIEIFFNRNRVASHVRTHARKRDPIMKPTHMPENHRKYLEYTPDDFRSWAGSVGDNTLRVVDRFLESGRAPEQGFKPCVSLRKLTERYSAEKLEEACRQVLMFSGEPTIRGIGILLKSPVKGTPKEDKAIRTKRKGHGITRGAEQFREGGDLK